MRKRLTVGFLVCGSLLIAQDRYRIDTVAGQRAPVGVAATATYLLQPQGLFADGSGNLYEVEVDGLVKKIAAGNTNISRVAGSLEAAAPGDGGAALNAGFNTPRYVVLDSSGNLLITDNQNCAIRRVDAVTQIISTYAGQIGNCGFGGDNGPATSALLNNPRGIAVDSAGNLFIADGNVRVRRVDAISHQITTIAGTGINGHTGDGGLATSANLTAFALAFDSLGNLYVAGNGWIRKIDSAGHINAFAGTGIFNFNGEGLAATSANLGNVRSMQFDGAGSLYYDDGTNARVRKIGGAPLVVTTVAGTGATGYSGDGGPATSATLTQPEGIAIDSLGTIYFSDFAVNVIRKISGGTITTYAGSVGPEGVAPTSGFLNLPVARAPIRVYAGGRLRRVDPAFVGISTVAGLSYNSPIGANGPALSAGFYFPLGIAFDSQNNLFVVDEGNEVVRRIDGVSDVVTTFAGMTGTSGYSGDNGPATSATLSVPRSLAFDPTGNTLYIADLANQVVRAVTNGTITTVAGNFALGSGFSGDNGPATSAQLAGPSGLAVDSTGNLFIADIANNRIREVRASDKVIITVVGTGTAGYSGDGGLATAATLNLPLGLRIDSTGDLLIADSGNSVVRKVHNGIISTIAGNGTLGYSGDGGVSTTAQINLPEDIAMDSFGHVFIADERESVIRRLTPQYQLTTSVNPPGAGTVTAGGYFDKGTNVNVQATASAGNVFAGFTGTTVSNANPVMLAMNSTQNLVANFISTPLQLIVNRLLSRSGNAVNVVVTIVNSSGTQASNVQLTIAKIGSVTPTSHLPAPLGTIGPGGASGTGLQFLNVGSPGAATTITLGGTYTGGSFSSTARITLP